jgi:hypothetical protein
VAPDLTADDKAILAELLREPIERDSGSVIERTRRQFCAHVICFTRARRDARPIINHWSERRACRIGSWRLGHAKRNADAMDRASRGTAGARGGSVRTGTNRTLDQQVEGCGIEVPP